MGKRILSSVLLTACLLPGLTGCGGKAKTAASQATPAAAARRWATCMLEFDKSGYMECLTGSKAELTAAEAFMDYLCALKDFKDAVIKAYGERGWRAFEQAGGAKLSLELADNRQQLAKAQWKVSGDSAEGRLPGESQVLHLTRKSGRWHIHAKDILTGGAGDLEKFASTWSRLGGLLREKKRRIGKAGVTAESLDKELGAEMLPILLGRGHS
jgi:hypothetical protein